MDFFVQEKRSSSLVIDDVLREIFTADRVHDAQEFFAQAVITVPHLARLQRTPQTSPRHAEGLWISDHIIRILVVIDAIIQGISFRGCEGGATDQIMSLALGDAEETIREFPGVFRAYALMHNIAKPDRILLVAQPGSAGEKEGFVPSSHRANPYSTQSEIARYDKMRRAGLVSDVEAIFQDGDKAIIAQEYASIREAIVRYCGLEVAYVKFLTEVCWSHDDVETFFLFPGNESAFVTFAARAAKAGLHVERYLDALLAITLIDHDIGRIDTRRSLSFSTFHRFVQAEHSAMPGRHAARQARYAHTQKIRIKNILTEHGLDPQEIFNVLGTKLGPERGIVMQKIYACIRGEGGDEVFGEHQELIRTRALQAGRALAREGLSV